MPGGRCDCWENGCTDCFKDGVKPEGFPWKQHDERRSGTERRLAISAQTPPVGDGAIVLDYVIEKLNYFDRHGIAEAGMQQVREDLIARAEIGEKKYGTKLRIKNGRRALVDLYQELLDAIMYSMQGRIEGDVAAGTYVELLLRLASQVAAELDKR